MVQEGEPTGAGPLMANPIHGAAAGHPEPDVLDAPSEAADDGGGGEQQQLCLAGEGERLLRPPSHLPQPEAPPGLTRAPSSSEIPPAPAASDLINYRSTISDSSIGKYLRDQGSIFTSAIAKRINSLSDADHHHLEYIPPAPVTEINLSSLKVIVMGKEEDGSENRMIITFFSRSNCRDCGAVRSFFRDRGVAFVEINLDVFPEREEELIRRGGTGRASVPQIFFGGKLLGGLVALNSLRNSGEFDQRLSEMVGAPPETNVEDEETPPPPLRVSCGGDGRAKDEDEEDDSMSEVARAMRERVGRRDRITRMKLVKSCFAGSDMVEALIHYLDCGRKKAVEVGRQLARKHFIHHVFRENEFEDQPHHFYRFLEHDPILLAAKCFNFSPSGSTNDREPKPASAVGQRLTKLMFAVLESYASDDRRRLDYARISSSEEFGRYLQVVQDLQRVDTFALAPDERASFFLNLYNAMVIHAVVVLGPLASTDRKAIANDFHYIVGGYAYSPSTIKNGIIRSNRRQPYSLVRPFGAGDARLELMLPKVNPLIHFGLCNGTRSSPAVRFFSPQGQGIEAELRDAAREFFHSGGLEVDLERRTVFLTRIIKWYAADFGQDKELLKWVMSFLDASRAGLLTHLLNDGGPINIVYQNFDWSLNSS